MGIKQQLKNTQDVAFEDLNAQVSAGAKFVVFSYPISLLAVTLRRLTPVYYLPPGGPVAKYRSTANKLSMIFGWWGVPWGPIRTIQSLAVNRKGGIDVTKDVMVNLINGM